MTTHIPGQITRRQAQKDKTKCWNSKHVCSNGSSTRITDLTEVSAKEIRRRAQMFLSLESQLGHPVSRAQYKQMDTSYLGSDEGHRNSYHKDKERQIANLSRNRVCWQIWCLEIGYGSKASPPRQPEYRIPLVMPCQQAQNYKYAHEREYRQRLMLSSVPAMITRMTTHIPSRLKSRQIQKDKRTC